MYIPAFYRSSSYPKNTRVVTMNNNRKTMLVLVTMLTLTVGVILSAAATITIPRQQVLAQQNTTAGNNMTGAGNMTVGSVSGVNQDEGAETAEDEVPGCPPGSIWQAEPPLGVCVAERQPCPPGQIWTGPPR